MDAKVQAEVVRKANAGIPLVGNEKGQVDPQALQLWQQIVTANAAAKAADVSHQQTGSGVGSTGATSSLGVTNTTVPTVTNNAVTNWGFTAIVGLGALFAVTAIFSAFRRSRR